MYGEQDLPVTRRKCLQKPETQYEVKNTCFCSSSYVVVYLGDTVWINRWKISDTYTAMRTQIQVAPIVVASAWGYMTGSAASGGQENCCMVG
jgi:hypothetical protein